MAVPAKAREQVIHRRVNDPLGLAIALDHDVGPPHSLPCLFVCIAQPLIPSLLRFLRELPGFPSRRLRIQRGNYAHTFCEIVSPSPLGAELHVERGLLEAWRQP